MKIQKSYISARITSSGSSYLEFIFTRSNSKHHRFRANVAGKVCREKKGHACY